MTVTGVNDLHDDGDVVFSIVTAPAASTDAGYSTLNAADVAVTNVDDDTAAILVTAAMGLAVTEAAGAGNQATFTIVLTAQPTANVSISLSSSDTTEGTVSPASVVFTSANWSTPQTVTVTGVDDDVDDGNVAFSIVTGAGVQLRSGLQRPGGGRRDGQQHRQRHRWRHRDRRSGHQRHRGCRVRATAPPSRWC